jgi:hypothetical protein
MIIEYSKSTKEKNPMDKDISKILEQTGLPDELVVQLQEAFEEKVKNARLEIEDSVRADLSEQYENDKSQLLEAMDNIITDALKVSEQEKAEEINKLAEARTKLEAAISESKAEYQRKLKEGLSKAAEVVATKVDAEITSLKEAKASLNASKTKILSESKALMEQEKSDFSGKLAQIDAFVVEQVTRELRELHEDHQALIQTRAKLIQENEERFKAARAAFIKEAAAKVDTVITEGLKSEMKQLHEEVENYRQNSFGRKIFESFVAEYMSSYFAEGSETKKLTAMLESVQAELVATKSQLTEATNTIEAANRKAKIVEAKSVRDNTLNKLLNTLSGSTKSTMKGLLETVKTEKLEEAFHNYLPILTESKKTEVKTKPATSTTVTGDGRSKLTETASNDAVETTEQNSEIAEIVKLAGIRK